jgi:hypothetical protein
MGRFPARLPSSCFRSTVAGGARDRGTSRSSCRRTAAARSACRDCRRAIIWSRRPRHCITPARPRCRSRTCSRRCPDALSSWYSPKASTRRPRCVYPDDEFQENLGRPPAALERAVAGGLVLAGSTLVPYEWLRGPRSEDEPPDQEALLPAAACRTLGSVRSGDGRSAVSELLASALHALSSARDSIGGGAARLEGRHARLCTRQSMRVWYTSVSTRCSSAVSLGISCAITT